MGLKCVDSVGPCGICFIIIILPSCICCSTPGDEFADTVVEPSDEAGDSPRAARWPPIVLVDTNAWARSFFANASVVSVDDVVVFAEAIEDADDDATDVMLNVLPTEEAACEPVTLDNTAVPPLPMESNVGARFFAARMGDPSASRFRRKLETTVEPALPPVTLIDVCSGMTTC